MKRIEDYFEPRVMFYRKEALEIGKKIQQESYNQGLKEAAELVRIQRIHSDFALGHENGEKMMAEKILRCRK